jgi:hypothetical protein
VSAVKGSRIEKNTLISTGFRSTAVIILGESVITVRPVTRLSLEEIIKEQDKEQVSVYLQTGRVRADVKPPTGGNVDFTIKSPSVTASVRGTSFEFDTENLQVDEGRVQYSLTNGSKASASVSAGGRSYVDETKNTVISPFEAATEVLLPARPFGNDSGNPVGDIVPAIVGTPVIPDNTPPAILPPVPDVGIGFEWD